MPQEQKTWEVHFRGSERPGRFSGSWLLAIHNHSYTVWKVKGTIRAGRKLYRRLFRLLGGKVQTSPQTVWKQAHLTGTQILLWQIFSIPHRTATDPTIYYSVVKQVCGISPVIHVLRQHLYNSAFFRDTRARGKWFFLPHDFVSFSYTTANTQCYVINKWTYFSEQKSHSQPLLRSKITSTMAAFVTLH